jgi:hypothetical protein
LRRGDTNLRHSHYQTGVIAAVNVLSGLQTSRQFTPRLAVSLQSRFPVIPVVGTV